MFSAVFSDIVIPHSMTSALMRSTFSSLDTPQHDYEIDTCGELANVHFFSILLVGKANVDFLEDRLLQSSDSPHGSVATTPEFWSSGLGLCFRHSLL